jgi:hypothetical protein
VETVLAEIHSFKLVHNDIFDPTYRIIFHSLILYEGEEVNFEDGVKVGKCLNYFLR